ncbi:hypothetical protein ACAF76_006280 [Brevibacillus sp. TJ4]|uniref:hypothetical protein n=1 Tax=Brevibacillus sp. TJ4 TaxID=3234853 RepID=UPI0037D215F5
MKCPECGYEMNVKQKQWDYQKENGYIIHSKRHHDIIFQEIVDHYLRLQRNEDGGKPSYHWIIIDECETQISDCSTCFLESSRIKRRAEQLYRERNIELAFPF